jgi:hypothetical protein
MSGAEITKKKEEKQMYIFVLKAIVHVVFVNTYKIQNSIIKPLTFSGV